MPDEIYTFGNGVKVHRRHVLDHQVNRYQSAGAGNLHEPEEEHWLGALIARCRRPDPLFYDIGGGIGYYTLAMLLQRPGARAVVFEPLPSHAAAIRENIALNGIPAEKIRLIEAAASDSDGEVGFADQEYSSRIATGAEATLRVPSCDIAARLAAEEREVDIAKLDIQGGEEALLTRVIAGGQAGKVDSWIVGTHSDALYDSCLRLLSRHWTILHKDPKPPFQPDGLIVATRPSGPTEALRGWMRRLTGH